MKTADYITIAQARGALRTLYHTDPEVNAMQVLKRAIEDDLAPKDARGNWRPSRLLMTVAGIFIAAVCVFLYFSIR